MGAFYDINDGGISGPEYIKKPTGRGRTLRMGVKGIVSRRSGRVLLIKEHRSDGTTFWTLPGGGVHINESFIDGLKREFREELRLDVRVNSLVDTCTYHHSSLRNTSTKYHLFNCWFAGRPSPNGSEGIVDVQWFERRNLPESTVEPFQQIIANRHLSESQSQLGRS